MRDGEAGKKTIDEERSGVLKVTQLHESLENHPTVTKSIGVALGGPILPQGYTPMRLPEGFDYYMYVVYIYDGSCAVKCVTVL